MSIQERGKAIKSPRGQFEELLESDIFEEEFDIVPKSRVSEGYQFASRKKEIIVVVLLLLFTAFISFFIGRLSAKEDTIRARVYGGIPVSGLSEVDTQKDSQKTDISTQGEVKGVLDGEVVASKSGKKYHYPWCAGAKQIVEKNKITFASIEEAQNAGYTPASNCKGLK